LRKLNGPITETNFVLIAYATRDAAFAKRELDPKLKQNYLASGTKALIQALQKNPSIPLYTAPELNIIRHGAEFHNYLRNSLAKPN
jgi:hypothetical protein